MEPKATNYALRQLRKSSEIEHFYPVGNFLCEKRLEQRESTGKKRPLSLCCAQSAELHA